MKIKLLAAGIFLALAAPKLFAQEQGFHAGLTTGYYYTTILDKGLFDSPTYEHKATFSAAPIGVALGYQWEGGFGIQAEFINAKIKQEFKILHIAEPGASYSPAGEKEIALTYWQLPLLFKLQKGSEKVRFNFVLGPQVSFLSEGEDRENYDIPRVIYEGKNEVDNIVTGKNYIIGSTEENAHYTFNNLSVGLLAGAGVDIFVKEDLYISANLRAGYNFTEIRKEKEGTKFVDTHKNTSIVSGPQDIDDRLYVKELRTAAFGGLQVGVHYLFGQ